MTKVIGIYLKAAVHFFLLSTCISFYSLTSFAQADITPPETVNNIQIVSGDNYFPFASVNLPSGGWSNAIVIAVFKAMNQDIDIDILPWKRGYKWTHDGLYWGTFPYVFTHERAEEFLYSTPINSVPVRIYVHSDSDIHSAQSLYKKSLCLPHGYQLDNWSEAFFKKYELQINQTQDSISCAGQVIRNWSDFGLINGYFTEEQIFSRFGSPERVRILDFEIGRIPLHFIVSKQVSDAEARIKQFNQALEQIKSTGLKAKIDNEYLGTLSSGGMTPNY